MKTSGYLDTCDLRTIDYKITITMLTDITKLETVDYDNDIQLDDLDDIIKVTGNTDKANLKKISKAQIAAKKKFVYIYKKKNLN